MTVATVAKAPRGGSGGRDERKAADARQAGEFDAAMRRRRRRRPEDEEPVPAAAGNPQASVPPLAQWPRPAVPGAAGQQARERAAAGIDAADPRRAVPEAGSCGSSEPFAFGANAQLRRDGDVMHLRFTQGPWAGTELQAALHAGQVVVTLRAASPRQQRTLQQLRSALAEEVARETGHAIRLEIVDAAR
ncbi:hypothetical protein [Paracidovorax citrulli]